MPAKQNTIAILTPTSAPIPPPPKLPDTVLVRFPELKQYQAEMETWVKKLQVSIQGVPTTNM